MRVLIVDGSNMVARNTHVFAEASTEDGRPTGGIYGTLSMVRKFLSREPHDAVIATTVEQVPQFRKDLAPEYKQQRAGNRNADQERVYRLYRQQMPYAYKAWNPAGITTCRAPGFEGDDQVAALVSRLREAGHTATIMSSDKDFTQLVTDDDSVQLYDPGSESFRGHDAAYLLARCLDPKASDNLDGVAGCGPKTADWILSESGATEPEGVIAWCQEHAANAIEVYGSRYGKAIAQVVAEQQIIRRNWMVTNLSLTVDDCNAAMKFRRSIPDKAAFKAACKDLNLRPLLDDFTAVWPAFSRLRCPV